MPSAKELAKALAYRGEIRNTPQNSFLGGVANFLAPVSEFLDRDKLPESIPFLGGLSAADLTGVKGTESLVRDMSHGTPPIRGASLQTAKVDPRLFDVAGLGGAMMPAAKSLSKAALRNVAEQVQNKTGILGRNVIDPRMNMFAGERAKTADKQTLKVAKDMKAAGVPDETIHAKTKWFFGSADGKPRFEIDDSAAKVNENIDVTRGYGIRSSVNEKISTASDRMLEAQSLFNEGVPANKVYKMTGYVDKGNGLEDFYTPPLPKLFEHDALAAAYPSTDNLSLRVLSKEGARGSGAYDSVRDSINLFTANADSTKDILATKDVALHELQHAIQQREGFARGGSPEMFKQSQDFNFKQLQDAAILDKTMRARNFNQLEALNRFQELFGRKPEPGAFAALERIGSGKELDMARDSAKLAVNPYESYKRLAGEAEARLTQSRMNMTAAERAASYPPSMFDVPVKDQIVRYGGDVGGAMMHRPKTEFEILHDTAQRNAALPVEQGGLGLPANNTYIDRANAPGMFPEDAVHFSRAGGDYTTLDSGKYAIAPFDAVGTHVGTPQAAMERFENTVGYKVNDPNYINDELKGASYPVRISNSKPLMNQNGMPFGEEDLNTLLRQAGGHNSPDISGGDRELNAKLRKKLFEDQGYTNIPYFNEVEGKGSVSQIVPPANIRSRYAAYDPFRRHEADILAGVGVGGMLDPQAIAEALRQQDRK